MPIQKLARKDAAARLVKEIDTTAQFWNNAHPEKVANPEWPMPLALPIDVWRQIAEAFRPLTED
jgi:hypothetical protein